MATNSAASVARTSHHQMIHYLRKSISFADAGTTVEVGTIPAGALILYPISGVNVNVAFDGDTTNTLDLGVTGTLEKYAGDLALGTVAFVPMDVSTAVRVTSTDETIQAVVVSTASAAAGTAEIVIAFIPDNDG